MGELDSTVNSSTTIITPKLSGEEFTMIPNALLEMNIVQLSTAMERLDSRAEELWTIGCAKTGNLLSKY